MTDANDNISTSGSGSFHILAEDSQDPNDDITDLNIDYTTKDLWDAFVDMTQKQLKNKGKKKVV